MRLSEAWMIFKNIRSEGFTLKEKVKAIEVVSEAATLNSITKAEMQESLRFILDTFDLSGAVVEADIDETEVEEYA